MFQWLDGQSVLMRAPAKLNLHLQVLGRRTDGFHDLETVMVKLALHDTLRLSKLSSSSSEDPSHINLSVLACAPFFQQAAGSLPLIPTDERNLVVRAARLLQFETGCTAGADIELYKRIPVEAGLGGGSSDAAATLVGLNQLWGLSLSVTELETLAAKLGSDIPFFINTHTAALCRGRGELITPIPVRCNFPVLLAQPENGLSTPAVFKKWGEINAVSDQHSVGPILDALRLGKSATVSHLLSNALQSPAEHLSPQLLQLTSLLRKFNLPGFLMTGSGSCCFGLCHSFRQATSLSSHLRATRMARVSVSTLHP
ncbi:MAG: 4-(cytidine 5'-diphospho)-2-C-methyl-D-erythritol kinase [Planctomycetaceae bacterium]